jgi:hypothetical protein
MPKITFVTDPNDEYVSPLLNSILDLIRSGNKYRIYKERLDQSVIKYDIHTDISINQQIIDKISYHPVQIQLDHIPDVNEINHLKHILTRLLLTQVDWIDVIDSNIIQPQYRNKPIYRPKSVVDDIVYLINKPLPPPPKHQEWSPYYLDGDFRNLNDNIKPYHIRYAFIKAWITNTNDVDQIDQIKVFPNLIVEIPPPPCDNIIKPMIDMVNSMIKYVDRWTVIPIIPDPNVIYQYRSKYPSLVLVDDKLISDNTITNIDMIPPVSSGSPPQDIKELYGYYYLLSDKPSPIKKCPEIQR